MKTTSIIRWVRVDQLILVDVSGATPKASNDWLIAGVRWLTSGRDARREVRLQYMARSSSRAALPANSGVQQTFHPALKSKPVLRRSAPAHADHPSKVSLKPAILEFQEAQQLQQTAAIDCSTPATALIRFSFEVRG